MAELCLTMVLILDPQAASMHAAAAAASARPCTRVLTLTGKPEADRALVGSGPERVTMVSYGPAAAAAAVSRWPNRERTIGGIGPANALFKAPIGGPRRHRAPLRRSAVKLLPARTTPACRKTPTWRAIGWTPPGKCWRYAGDAHRLSGQAPAGCHGLVAWFEGPAATPAGLAARARWRSP